ncbi:MAG: glycosyltransferase family 2 protein [Bacteroidales bacterium]|nr:glycosyltransferase family 2 protein [Bacteroidales bacterium]
MDKLPLISIIVPVYNVKDYLLQCLNSLIAINYPSKEIIIVDDCSTDGSLDLCFLFKEKHPDLILIQHEKNQGVQAARITGVTNASGKYVMFVDSDDFVDPEILNHLVSTAIQSQADLVCVSSYWYSKGAKSEDRRSIYGVYHGKEIEALFQRNLMMDEGLYKAGMPMYLWGKLFKKDAVLESLHKGLGLKYGEDEITVVDYLMNYTDTLVSLEAPLYYYRQHSLQITSKTIIELMVGLYFVMGTSRDA